MGIFMKKSYKSVLLVTLLLLTACSSQKFFNIEPEGNDYDYYEGRKIETLTGDDIDASLNYEFQDNGNFVFYLYVANNSERNVLIDPDTFLSVNSTNRTDDRLVEAIDPEHQIERIKNDMSDLDDSHAASVGMNCLFATFNVVADIADGEEGDAVIDAGYWASEIDDENKDYEYNTDRLKNDKLFWENEVLRITTLYPGEETGGMVFFPIVPEAKKFKIVFEIEDVEFEFPFKQHIK